MTVKQTDILGVLKVERDSWRATAERYAARLAEVERELERFKKQFDEIGTTVAEVAKADFRRQAIEAVLLISVLDRTGAQVQKEAVTLLETLEVK